MTVERRGPADGLMPEEARRLARDVEALPGVRGVSVVLGGNREVTELRVRVGSEAAPAIVANAAGHVLRRSGFDFAPDAIRVVPAPTAANGHAPVPGTPGRPDGDPGDGEHPEGSATGHAPGRGTPALSRPGGTPPLPAVPATGAGPQFHPATTGGVARQAAPPSRYLVLSDLAIVRSGPRVTCTVRLRRGDTLYEGTWEELDSESGRARAGARAALSAASAAVEGLAFGVEGAATLDIFGRRHVAVSVEAAAGRRVATLSGMVAVEPARSVEEAGALAALRAIERWISM